MHDNNDGEFVTRLNDMVDIRCYFEFQARKLAQLLGLFHFRRTVHLSVTVQFSSGSIME